MLGGLVGYSCLALSLGPRGGLWLLLASRLPIGLLKQSLAVSRAAVADCTRPGARMRPMSRLGAAVGSGLVRTPFLTLTPTPTPTPTPTLTLTLTLTLTRQVDGPAHAGHHDTERDAAPPG